MNYRPIALLGLLALIAVPATAQRVSKEDLEKAKRWLSNYSAFKSWTPENQEKAVRLAGEQGEKLKKERPDCGVRYGLRFQTEGDAPVPGDAFVFQYKTTKQVPLPPEDVQVPSDPMTIDMGALFPNNVYDLSDSDEKDVAEDVKAIADAVRAHPKNRVTSIVIESSANTFPNHVTPKNMTHLELSAARSLEAVNVIAGLLAAEKAPPFDDPALVADVERLKKDFTQVASEGPLVVLGRVPDGLKEVFEVQHEGTSGFGTSGPDYPAPCEVGQEAFCASSCEPVPDDLAAAIKKAGSWKALPKEQRQSYYDKYYEKHKFVRARITIERWSTKKEPRSAPQDSIVKAFVAVWPACGSKKKWKPTYVSWKKQVSCPDKKAKPVWAE